jgi:hypothetical protein
MRLWPLTLVLLPLLATAQPAAKNAAIVTGHVYCADTNAPARLAVVMLEPVSVLGQGKADVHGPQELIHADAVQTGLDGSFTIPNVESGTYYVLAYKPGYLSPLSFFSEGTLSHPSAEDRKRITQLVPRLTIESGLSASLDVRLERGAAISGTVLFDDGTPAAGLPVHVLVHQKEGEKQVWSLLPPNPIPFIDSMSQERTDDLGHYRLAGLAARDYLVEVELSMQRFELAVQPGTLGGASSIEGVTRLTFYSGNTARRADAKPVRTTVGDETVGDITIPISKLHTVTGELTAAHDGHLINFGQVELLDPDGTTELESAKVQRTDGRFHLLFAPEGDYTLRVYGAADVTYEDVPYPPGATPRTHEEVHMLRRYGTTDRPLTVHDDLPELVIAIPEKAPAGAGTNSP